VLDSVKDLRSRVDNTDEFVPAKRRDEATIILTVLGRGVGSAAYGRQIRIGDFFGDTLITNTPLYDDTFWIATVLEVGEYRREVLGTLTREGGYASLGAWKYWRIRSSRICDGGQTPTPIRFGTADQTSVDHSGADHDNRDLCGRPGRRRVPDPV
jgi:hypothetical protein